jgi:hypothetical protein
MLSCPMNGCVTLVSVTGVPTVGRVSLLLVLKRAGGDSGAVDIEVARAGWRWV